MRIRNATTVNLPDDPNYVISADEWNADLVTEMSAGKIIGRAAGLGTGPFQELGLSVDALGKIAIGGPALTSPYAPAAATFYSRNEAEHFWAMVLPGFGPPSTNEANFTFLQSRATTPGAHGAVQTGDYLGSMYWCADDGTTYDNATAFMAAVVEGVVSTHNVGAAIIFGTAPNTGNSSFNFDMTERFRIGSDGTLNIGAIPKVVIDGGYGLVNRTLQTNVFWRDVTVGYGNVFNSSGDARAKTRGATPTTHVALQVGDEISGFYQFASDGTSYLATGYFTFAIDGAVTTGSAPTKFSVATGDHGYGSERFAISSIGKVSVLTSISSTSTTTGSLVVAGGAGIAENAYIGGKAVLSASNAHLGIGGEPDIAGWGSGTGLITIQSTNIAVLELASNHADALDQFVGFCDFVFRGYEVASIFARTSGSTADSRGAYLGFATRVNGSGVPIEHMTLDNAGALNLPSGVYKVGGNQVVGARDTGWTAMTGTPNKAATYDTSTVTLAQLAGRVAQLQAALTTHGLIGA